MGSVMDWGDCPRCKSVESYMSDFYYKTGEEYSYCSECGYSKEMSFKRDGNGEFLLMDSENGTKVDNLIQQVIINEEPYGSYRVEYENGGANIGTLTTPKDYGIFVSEVVSLTNQENEIKNVVFSKFVGGEIVKETIY